MISTKAYFFGIFILTIYIYITFISRSNDKKRYKYRIISSAIALLTGVIIDLIGIFEKPFGIITLISLSPFIYLVCYEIFRKLYRPWIGNYAYSPQWEKNGNRVLGKGYPMNRIVTNADYVFAFTLHIVPIIILLFFLSFFI